MYKVWDGAATNNSASASTQPLQHGFGSEDVLLIPRSRASHLQAALQMFLLRHAQLRATFFF